MTFAEAKEASGMCMDCKEYTSIAEPCCNAGVWFEGSVWTIEDLESVPEEV